MTDEKVPGNAGMAPKKGGARAAVGYPYFNFADSLDVAKAIHVNAGGSCSADQLAAFLNYKTTKSGTYQTRISAAKQFGFIRSENGQISVTERAQKILSPVLPEDATNASADAFLSVELFTQIYEKFKGSTIPPKIGMRNLLLQAFSITPDRVDPAVRVLFESAEQAGFFKSSGDQSRLIRPISKSNDISSPRDSAPSTERQESSRSSQTTNTSNGAEGPGGIHSAIIGLLRELPAPGSLWPHRQKQRFVKAFQATLDFIYPNESDEEDIT